MKRILVTGGTGMVGVDVCRALSKRNEVYAGTIEKEAEANEYELAFADVSNMGQIVPMIRHIRPDYIVHLAALTDVDLCERNKELARKINVDGMKNVAFGAKLIKAKLVYASTNYVFDGKKGMYNEEDAPNPVNYYALTKLEGEREALKYENSVVTRICPFGLGTKTRASFCSEIITKLGNKQKMNLFTDQFFSPIFTYNYARVLEDILKRDFSGVINIAGRERLSRYEFALEVARVFELDESLIVPTKMEDAGLTAQRPKDTSLSISKARELFGNIFLNAREGVEWMKRIYETEYKSF